MRWKYVFIGLGALIALHFVGASIAPRYLTISGLLGQKAEDHGYYYRFKSAYMHKDERIDFDIVVGCSVRVTTYGDNSSSWDALRYPSNFVKATKDGGAIWQHIQDACQGETTEGGSVPNDFLPGAIYFKDKNDLSFGIGYLLEDAFEGEDADLKFLGASISRATREEFDAFQPIAQTNLIDPKPFTFLRPSPTRDQVVGDMWNKKKWMDWAPQQFSCHGVKRLPITDPTIKQEMEKYWPKERPRFWTYSKEDRERFGRFSDQKLKADTDPRTGAKYAEVDKNHGLPTRVGGGRWRSNGEIPPEIFPSIESDAVPWFGPELLDSSTPIYRDVDTGRGKNLGRAYCYIPLLSWFVNDFMPDYEQRRFVPRVDGEIIYLDDKPAPAINMLEIFFERTDYIYHSFQIWFS
jgi:hypothetical protein